MMGRGFLSARGRIPSWLKLLGNCVAGVLQRAGNRTEPLGPVSWARMIKYLPAGHWCERRMESYPKFHNEIGVPMVRIGCHEFECIGDKPPQDHPHIYLNIGDASEIVCPYCSTLFRFDPTLGAREADPVDCADVGAV
jgi:uncharacterized Zn-finger protein